LSSFSKDEFIFILSDIKLFAAPNQICSNCYFDKKLTEFSDKLASNIPDFLFVSSNNDCYGCSAVIGVTF